MRWEAVRAVRVEHGSDATDGVQPDGGSPVGTSSGSQGFSPVENVFQGGEFSGWCVGAMGLWSFPIHGSQLTAWGGESWF